MRILTPIPKQTEMDRIGRLFYFYFIIFFGGAQQLNGRGASIQCRGASIQWLKSRGLSALIQRLKRF